MQILATSECWSLVTALQQQQQQQETLRTTVELAVTRPSRPPTAIVVAASLLPSDLTVPAVAAAAVSVGALADVWEEETSACETPVVTSACEPPPVVSSPESNHTPSSGPDSMAAHESGSYLIAKEQVRCCFKPSCCCMTFILLPYLRI